MSRSKRSLRSQVVYGEKNFITPYSGINNAQLIYTEKDVTGYIMDSEDFKYDSCFKTKLAHSNCIHKNFQKIKLPERNNYNDPELIELEKAIMGNEAFFDYNKFSFPYDKPIPRSLYELRERLRFVWNYDIEIVKAGSKCVITVYTISDEESIKRYFHSNVYKIFY